MSKHHSQIALIGYSGHAYVVLDIFFSQGIVVSAYCERQEVKENPFMLTYLGNEADAKTLDRLKAYRYFVCVGDNQLRRRISDNLASELGAPENALHKTAILSRSMICGSGNMFGPNCVINAKAEIGNGVICNTGSIIEHECRIRDYVHIAPGAVLCGNVSVGENTLVGAGSVVLPGISIGKNAIIGAGSVVTKNVNNGVTFIGSSVKRL